MSEMLGNQYFLARRYALAARELDDILEKNPRSKAIRKKLIVCHVQEGNLERALQLLVSLVHENDIDCIVETDPLLDDCPCPELVYDFEERFKNISDSKEYLIKLAILWLYCDVEKSYGYFREYQKSAPKDETINEIIDYLTSYLISNGLKGNK
ncbi:MAG: tetratricopeptide repeat protein [Calditrichaeota bacterium]|nr:tetratricopeptide repeat protein [Calditrichota bacterium]